MGKSIETTETTMSKREIKRIKVDVERLRLYRELGVGTGHDILRRVAEPTGLYDAIDALARAIVTTAEFELALEASAEATAELRTMVHELAANKVDDA